jgi:diguanylate cyclase (GGDEF)-like protein
LPAGSLTFYLGRVIELPPGMPLAGCFSDEFNGPVSCPPLLGEVPNLTTLSAMVVFTPAVAGCLLLLSWLQHPRQALGVWGSGFLSAAVAATLIIAARGAIPDFWSIVVGNALLAVAYGILWCGARAFNGKTVPIPIALIGLLVWLIACSIGPIYAWPEARASIVAAISICYTLLAVLELWRGRGDGAWRWPIMALLLVHAASIPIHIPIAGAWKHPDPADLDLLTFSIFEVTFASICGAYLLGGLVKDQIAARFRRASLTDPLTGVTNRRGFSEIGERLLARAQFDKEPFALAMFDLDRFKRINDQFGHAAGDEVLIAFCRLAAAQLRPSDLFARIGGEEFVALLPNTAAQDAFWLTERVRAAIEAAPHTVEERVVRLTVSAGVVSSNGGSIALEAFLFAADRALFRAKAAGRNRVELATSILNSGPRTRRPALSDLFAA